MAAQGTKIRSAQRSALAGVIPADRVRRSGTASSMAASSKNRQEIPGLKPHNAHHRHRRVGDIHGSHHAHRIDGGKHCQRHRPAPGDGLALAGGQHRAGQQQHRPGQAEQRDGQVLPAEQSQLSHKKVVFVQCTQQNRQVTQRIFQNEQQLFQLVHVAAAHPADLAVIGAEGNAVPFHQPGHRQRGRQHAGSPVPAAAAGTERLPQQHQRQKRPQQIDVGLGHIDPDTGGGIDSRVPGSPGTAGQLGQHQVVAAQQRRVIAQAGAHPQRQRQQHDTDKGGTEFFRPAQRQPAQHSIDRQVGDAPAVQAAQRPEAQQPCHKHADGPGQKGQHQKADRFADRGRVGGIQIFVKAVGHALDAAVLAVLLQGIAGGVVDLGLPVCLVLHRTGGGVGIDPGTGEGVVQSRHIVGIPPLGVKVKPAHADGVGAQEMFRLVGGLHRRIGKGKQQAADRNAGRGLGGEAAQPVMQHARRRHGSQAGQHTAGGDNGRRNPAVQVVEYPPVVGPGHTRQAGQQTRQPPQGCRFFCQFLKHNHHRIY